MLQYEYAQLSMCLRARVCVRIMWFSYINKLTQNFVLFTLSFCLYNYIPFMWGRIPAAARFTAPTLYPAMPYRGKRAAICTYSNLIWCVCVGGSIKCRRVSEFDCGRRCYTLQHAVRFNSALSMNWNTKKPQKRKNCLHFKSRLLRPTHLSALAVRVAKFQNAVATCYSMKWTLLQGNAHLLSALCEISARCRSG